VNDWARSFAGAAAMAGYRFSPVATAAGEQAHGATIAAHDQAISVVLDLITQSSPEGGFEGNGGKQGGIATGEDVLRANSLEMAACREPPQLSCCRCASRIATSDSTAPEK
jgi:hypothetical protein